VEHPRQKRGNIIALPGDLLIYLSIMRLFYPFMSGVPDNEEEKKCLLKQVWIVTFMNTRARGCTSDS
jgi:hypothetical protein